MTSFTGWWTWHWLRRLVLAVVGQRCMKSFEFESTYGMHACTQQQQQQWQYRRVISESK
jgi:hypothetical protein